MKVHITCMWHATYTLLVFFRAGCWACSAKDIIVNVGPSGRQVQGKTEYMVFVNNFCNCPVEGIMLACPDFQTVEPVNPIYMMQDHHGRCLINQSRAIPTNTHVQFNYSWNEQFAFPVIAMKPVGC